MAHPRSDREVIQLLGVPALAAALDYTEHAIIKWRQRGIPWKERARVARLASAKRIKLPADFTAERRAA